MDLGSIRGLLYRLPLTLNRVPRPVLASATEQTPPPSCPQCGAPMKLRTAGRGPNAGKPFWGCSRYPNCRGTRSNDDQAPGAPPGKPVVLADSVIGGAVRVPVDWSDFVRRRGWVTEYTSVGALAGFAREHLDIADEELIQCLSQSLLLSRRTRSRSPNEESRAVGALLAKVLQRGRVPLPTLDVEKAALINNGLTDWFVELPDSDPEIAFELSKGFKGKITRQAALQALTTRLPFVLDEEFAWDSGAEVSLFDLQGILQGLGAPARSASCA